MQPFLPLSLILGLNMLSSCTQEETSSDTGDRFDEFECVPMVAPELRYSDDQREIIEEIDINDDGILDRFVSAAGACDNNKSCDWNIYIRQSNDCGIFLGSADFLLPAFSVTTAKNSLGPVSRPENYVPSTYDETPFADELDAPETGLQLPTIRAHEYVDDGAIDWLLRFNPGIGRYEKVVYGECMNPGYIGDNFDCGCFTPDSPSDRFVRCPELLMNYYPEEPPFDD